MSTAYGVAAGRLPIVFPRRAWEQGGKKEKGNRSRLHGRPGHRGDAVPEIYDFNARGAVRAVWPIPTRQRTLSGNSEYGFKIAYEHFKHADSFAGLANNHDHSIHANCFDRPQTSASLRRPCRRTFVRHGEEDTGRRVGTNCQHGKTLSIR